MAGLSPEVELTRVGWQTSFGDGFVVDDGVVEECLLTRFHVTIAAAGVARVIRIRGGPSADE